MKYAFNSFVLEANIPVAIQGNDSLYTFQNITNSSITVLGSNNGTDWVSLCVVNAANAKTTHSAFKFLCINSGTLLVNRAAAGSSATTALVNESGTEVSSSNPLPVAQTVQSLTASATLADTTSECSITLSGQTIGSFTLLTSNDANLSLTLYAVIGGAERNISFCNPNFSGAVYGSISLAANTQGFYTFEIPSGATAVKLKLITRTSGSVAVNLYTSTGNISQVSLRGNVVLGTGTSRAGFIARSAVWTRESTTPVNANLTITGAAKTTFATSSGTALNASTSYGDKFAAAAGANVVGTLIIDASPDSGTTYYPVASVALTQIGGAGNFGAYLETPIVEATMRARLVNGASNQANAYLTTKMLG